MFHQFAVLLAEGCGEVAIDIEFARDLAVHKHRYDDLRLGFERAGEITASLSLRRRLQSFCPTMPPRRRYLIEKNARVRSHGSLVTPEKQRRWIRALFQHVEAHPVVLQHVLVQQLADAFHQLICRARIRIQAFDRPAGFLVLVAFNSAITLSLTLNAIVNHAVASSSCVERIRTSRRTHYNRLCTRPNCSTIFRTQEMQARLHLPTVPRNWKTPSAETFSNSRFAWKARHSKAGVFVDIRSAPKVAFRPSLAAPPHRVDPRQDHRRSPQVQQGRPGRKLGGLPQASTHASHLAMDTLAALLRGCKHAGKREWTTGFEVTES